MDETNILIYKIVWIANDDDDDGDEHDEQIVLLRYALFDIVFSVNCFVVKEAQHTTSCVKLKHVSRGGYFTPNSNGADGVNCLLTTKFIICLN